MYPVLKEPIRGMVNSRIRHLLFVLAGMIVFGAGAFAQHVANPFVGATQYLNPDYTAEVESAIATTSDATLTAQMKVVESYPTAVWLDRIAAIAGGTANNGRLGLAQHITTALAQQSGSQPVIITLVIYDLPGRDCAALASNGEISIAGNGTLTGIQQYEQNYITPIYNVLQSYATNPNLRFVLVIEPDSLPNLVTNTGMGAAPIANCVAANAGVSGTPSLDSVYVQGVQYALNTFHPLTNVYQYLDIGQSAWLGWTSNLGPGIQLFNGLVKGTTAGYASLDGFISNTSSYAPTVEPFMTATQQVGSGSVDSATFYQYDPAIDELSYIKEFANQATTAGFPSNVGFLIDTSRNGWGGTKRPAAASTATDLNTFVNQSKIDQRPVRGVWCNIQDAGMGVPPEANPGGFANLLAYVWVKPPGESDGTYPGSTYGGSSSTTGDPNCNPANTNALAGGPTDSLPNSPPAGTFWPTEFTMNVQNAYPAIGSTSAPAPGAPSFQLSAGGVTVAPGATANGTVTVAVSGGFDDAVALTISGLPAGVTATFNPPSVTGAGSSAITFVAANTAFGGVSTVTITGTSGTTTQTASLTLTVGSGPGVAAAISVAPATVSIAQGASTTATISVSGFTGNIALTVAGLPSGVTASFSANPTTTTTILQLSANNSATAGSTTVTINGDSGRQQASGSFQLTVVPPSTLTPGFSLSAPGGSMTVARGSSGTGNISVTGINGFTGTVTLTAAVTTSPSGAINPPAVSFNATSTVNVNGNTPGVATLTIVTTANSSSSSSSSSTSCTTAHGDSGSPPWRTGGALLAGLLFFALPKRRFRGAVSSLLLLLIALSIGAVGCSGTGATGTPCVATPAASTTPGAYVITVTGVSGSLTQTGTVTVAVQ